MRDQDGILSLQDGSWRPKIDLCYDFLVYKGSLRKGSAAFTEPMGEYEGDPQSTIMIYGPCLILTARGRRI